MSGELPPEEELRVRNSIGFEPLANGNLGPYLAGTWGPETSFWGIQRFKADLSQPPNSLSYNDTSDSCMTGVDCDVNLTPTHIELTPHPGEFTIQLRIEQGRFTTYPHLYPLIARETEVDWEPDNIAAIVVRREPSQGATSVPLATEPGRYVHPTGVDEKYAFDYRLDRGQGFFGDEGVDTLANGVSDDLMTDEKWVISFALLGGRMAETLVFSVTVEDPGEIVRIKYPKLYRAQTRMRVYLESGHVSVITWEDGPAIRYLNLAFYYDGILHSTPTVLPPGIPPLGWHASVLDYYCMRNLLAGRPYNTNLTADAAIDWVFAEEWDTVADLDEFMLSKMVQHPHDAERTWPVGILINSTREWFPLAMFSWLTRGDNLQPGGTTTGSRAVGAQEAWSDSELRRLYVGSTEFHLWDGATKKTTLLEAYPGWVVTYHLEPFGDVDDPIWDVKIGGKKLGEMRGWHSAFGIPGLGGGITGVHLTRHTRLGLIVETLTSEEGVRVNTFRLAEGGYSASVIASSDIGATGAQSAVHPNGDILTTYHSGGEIFIVRSSSAGIRWSNPVSLFPGNLSAPAVDPRTGIEYIAVQVSGDWVCKRKLTKGAAWVQVGTIVAVDDEDAIQAGLEVSPETENLLLFSMPVASVIRRFVSPNGGVNWTEL